MMNSQRSDSGKLNLIEKSKKKRHNEITNNSLKP